MANDSARKSFSVHMNGRMVVVDGDNLATVREWNLGSDWTADGWGCHSASPAGVALLSTPTEVRLLEANGDVRWTFAHESWIGYGRGCAWFSKTGDPSAVIPVGDGRGCGIVQLSIDSGSLVSEDRIEVDDPAGMWPLFQRDGWVAVFVTEGENAARAWFVRPSSPMQVFEAGWDDEVLTDFHPDGVRVLTTGLDAARMVVRTFPTEEAIREIRLPDEAHFGACFVGPHMVTRLYHQGITVAIDPEDQIALLDVDDGWLVSAGGDSWVSVTADAIRRWELT